MLKSVATLFGLSVAAMADSVIKSTNMTTRYFIGLFNGNEFPLAVDKCNPVDILGQAGSQIHKCVDENTIVWNYYTDLFCNVLDSTQVFNASYRNGLGIYGDFNCYEEYPRSFAEIEFAAGTCLTETKVTMHAAIESCAYISEDEVSIQVYCESDYAELYYFDSEGSYGADCDEDDLYNVANATEECGFMLKTGGVKVYGNVIDCVYYPPETTTTTTTTEAPDSDSANKNVLAYLTFFIIALLTSMKI